MGDIIGLVDDGSVRAVVGSTPAFDQIPEAIDSMARRQTTGRTVVLVDPEAT